MSSQYGAFIPINARALGCRRKPPEARNRVCPSGALSLRRESDLGLVIAVVETGAPGRGRPGSAVLLAVAVNRSGR